MKISRTLLGVILLLLVASLAACGDLSCWADLPATGETQTSTSAVSASASSTTSAPETGTTSSATTTPTPAPTTPTTGSALDAYKAEMKAWKNKYGAQMQLNYNILSSMSNPLDPTGEQVKAARTLADLMDGLVADLQSIQAPPDLSTAHEAYTASLIDMHVGVDRLAGGLEHGGFIGAIDVTRALTTIYGADKDGRQPRAALEQALGFSLTSAD